MAVTINERTCRGRKPPVSVNVLQRRAQLLSPIDREIVIAVLVRGQSAAAVGRIVGTDRSTLRRRVLKISRRITSRKFITAARAMPYLEREDAKIARLRYCEGATVASIGRQIGQASYYIRRRLDKIAAQMEVVGRKLGRLPRVQDMPLGKASGM